MNKITVSLIEDFLALEELISGGLSLDFEKFCNYTVFSNEYSKSFDFEDLYTGGNEDTGIDGLAIIVNGHLVLDTAEVDDLLESNGFLDVDFIFIQAKSSPSFSTKDVNHFFFGVEDFFADICRLPRNGAIKDFAAISDYIYGRASKFRRNPIVKAFYVTTGNYNAEDAHFAAVVDAFKTTMMSTNYFERVSVGMLGANEIGKLYRKTKNPISASFIFSNKISLPDVMGIEESLYGAVPFSEFKKLLVDENDNVRNVFEDNVRDFQGSKNPVNAKISETVTSDNPELFSVLNNGVTIVADTVRTSGNNITLEDYQIVNGCQTSSVLYENRHISGIDDVYIPLRIVGTKDEAVKSRITVSTNSQTTIRKEQLSAMSDFQKNLEHYYGVQKHEPRLYYERRSKQYNNDPSVVKRRIISIANQVKSFSSMFRQDPHMVTTYFGTLAKNMGENGSGLCEDDHQFAPYYMSGLAYYKLDLLFNAGEIDKKYRKVKFYLLMLVPMIASEESIPPLNSRKKVEAYCDVIVKRLLDDEKCKEIFEQAVQVIEGSEVNYEEKQSLKSKNMTLKILDFYKNQKQLGEQMGLDDLFLHSLSSTVD